MIIVRPATRVRKGHLLAAALQAYVLGGAGLNVARFDLMYLNPVCTFPNLSGLFLREDITRRARALLPIMATRVIDFLEVLDQPEAPPADIGIQCLKPRDCPFQEECWPNVPEHSILTIPGMRWEKKLQLTADRKLDPADLPPEMTLGGAGERYLESLRSGGPVVDIEALSQLLARLEYPLHFLDFETDAAAIPRFRGFRPYDMFPFQFSCHILNSDGCLTHREYLHPDESDPRKPLSEALVSAIDTTGSVIVYNAAFEKRVLEKLAGWMPRYAPQLRSIVDRLWDMLAIFRSHYTDYRFGGSNSLKRVAPTFNPALSYTRLGIRNGEEAQAAWDRMIHLPDIAEKQRLVVDLKAYCRQDSAAMVAILVELARLARATSIPAPDINDMINRDLSVTSRVANK